jgi:hypothetical protein
MSDRATRASNTHLDSVIMAIYPRNDGHWITLQHAVIAAGKKTPLDAQWTSIPAHSLVRRPESSEALDIDISCVAADVYNVRLATTAGSMPIPASSVDPVSRGRSEGRGR